MPISHPSVQRAVQLLSRLFFLAGLATAVIVCRAGSADAAGFEQVKLFEGPGGGSKLAGVSGMAVNVSGTGGAPEPGTVYALAANKLLRFSPAGSFQAVVREVAAEYVAVDQSDGDIYVLGSNHVTILTAAGSIIEEFGTRVLGQPANSIEATPESFHQKAGLAVGSDGTVYVGDLGFAAAESPQGHRVMVFKPQNPADHTNYVYAGRANDIATGPAYTPTEVATDAGDNLYIAADQSIYEFAKGEPDTPVCEYSQPKGGIRAMSVNPESGEVFYLSNKDGKGHQLVCDAEGRFFEPVSPFSVTPQPSATVNFSSAFSPAFTYSPDRPPGVLYAANSNGLGYIFAPPPLELKPVVNSESVSRVTTSTATLGALINPEGTQASYHFQYISDAAYQENDPGERFAGAVEAPVGGAPLGSGRDPLAASVAITGLSPGMTYHYRAVATSPDGEGVGAEQIFHTFPVEAPGLPDGRVYELVSPAQKNGGEVLPLSPVGSCGVECKPGTLLAHFTMQSSPDGDALAYEGRPFSFTEGAIQENEYVARRTAAGWVTTGLSPMLQGSGSRQGYKAFNPDLTRGLISQISPSLTPEAPSGFYNLYSQQTASPAALEALLTAEPPNRPSRAFNLTFVGASTDLSRVFFEANDALTGETAFAPEAVDGGEGKGNLYEWADGRLSLVNVLPGNTETIPGAVFGSGKQLALPGGNDPRSDFFRAVSADGSRVFWSDASGQVYVREDGETTREIPDAGRFLAASTDGSRVLLSDGHLVSLEGGPTVDLTEGQGGFQGTLGQSENLSDVYFVDTAALTGEEENDQGTKAQAGNDNLYAWHEGALSYVATLLASDNNPARPDGVGDWRASPPSRTAEASPGGRWVVFQSQARLTGYDNTGPCRSDVGVLVSGPCAEVFLYDSATGRLVCASCSPTGAQPLGGSSLPFIDQAEGSAPQPRYLSDTGRLFFDSADSLSPFDTNGEEQVGHAVEDVYEYEPEGVGTCTRAAGCISLISAGHEPVDSNFLAADEDAKNVFFTSHDQLVLKDHDDLVDVYDAREGGGIPAESEVARSECQGEACQVPVSAPNDPTPSSSTFEGAGNVNETKAEKKHAKKHKKKRHAKKKHAHKRAAKRNRGGSK